MRSQDFETASPDKKIGKWVSKTRRFKILSSSNSILLASNYMLPGDIKIRQIGWSATRKRGQEIDTISLQQTLILPFLTLHKTTNHFTCEITAIQKTSRQRITAKRSISHLQSSGITSVRSKTRSSLRVVSHVGGVI